MRAQTLWNQLNEMFATGHNLRGMYEDLISLGVLDLADPDVDTIIVNRVRLNNQI